MRPHDHRMQPDPIETRARAIASAISTDHVVCDRTAAWIWGVDALTYGELALGPPIDVCVPPGRQPTHLAGTASHTRRLGADDVVTISGLRVTTPLRTALDLGCRLWRRDAFATLDAFARLHALSAAELSAGARAFAGRRGVRQLRSLAPLVDPRAESQRESWVRLAILDAGLPTPDLQIWVDIDGVPTYRVDVGWRHRRVAVEYDGEEAHDSADKRAADAVRRAALRALGWQVIVVRRGDFTGAALDRWINETRRALASTYSNVRPLERGDRRRLNVEPQG